MKECRITYTALSQIPKESYREFIKENMIAAGFDMKKPIIVKPIPDRCEIIYQQKD